MSTNQAPPFPQPFTSTGTVYPMQSAIGTPEQHSIGPAPGFTYPPEEIRSSRNSANCPSPSNGPPRRPSAHDSPHQPLQVPPHTYPAFQMPQAQDTRIPSTTSSPPPVMVQMHDPRNNIRPAPGPYSNYNLQAQGMSQSTSQSSSGMLSPAYHAPRVHRNHSGNSRDDDDYQDGQGHSSTQGSYISSKAPPTGRPTGSRPARVTNSAHDESSSGKCCCCG